ncbi:hypothetical protein TRIUR3_21289 [Triticum urartu]|uniref:Uncharacterized protein n=1 Tax=Triticum urartu TaxID=4572 RepID=M8A0V6_TRIUA|nr:hypothetical protein TRIUR3_21289 [Triticum urartu]
MAVLFSPEEEERREREETERIVKLQRELQRNREMEAENLYLQEQLVGLYFIVSSDDESGKKGGEEEIYVEEWHSVFPSEDDDGTSPDPALTEGGHEEELA